MLVEGIEVKEQHPLAAYTSFKVGGRAEYFAELGGIQQLTALLRWVREKDLNFFMLGRGTNLLVKDGGIQGLVLKLSGVFKEVGFNGEIAQAGAGMDLIDFVRKAQAQGLAGMEFLSGIPGSLGGALAMNAGAHGREIGELVQEVTLLDAQGAIQTWGRDKLIFNYRQSNLQDKVVLMGKLLLTKADPKVTAELIRKYAQERQQKQPLSMPNAGSVFRNPEGDFAGRLIEEAGLKGYTLGDAQVSPKHANFIVNRGQATAGQILELIKHIQKEVKTKTGKELELEVKVVGVDT